MTDFVPNGYIEDSVGRLVPCKIVRPERLVEDQTVRDLVARAQAASAQLGDLKAGLMDDVDAYLRLVAERYGVTLATPTGNVVMESFDARMRIEKVRADRITIGPEIQAAEVLVRSLVDEIEDPTARAIVDRAFRRNRKTAELSVSRLVDLVGVEIDDDRWRRAVQAIRDAMRATASAVYFRAYTRTDADSQWTQVPLDFSSIMPCRAATRPAPELTDLGAWEGVP